MARGDVVEYRMIVEGGRVNFDLHGHGGGQSATCEKDAARPVQRAVSTLHSTANMAGSGATAIPWR